MIAEVVGDMQLQGKTNLLNTIRCLLIYMANQIIASYTLRHREQLIQYRPHYVIISATRQNSSLSLTTGLQIADI